MLPCYINLSNFFLQDSGAGTPVTLRVDQHGFYLHWIDQNHEMDYLDIATIRDTRTGKYAKIPKVSYNIIFEVYYKLNISLK